MVSYSFNDREGIIAECVDGFYNNTCTAKCGHCKDGKTCDKITGSCPDACMSNFQEPLCQGKLFLCLFFQIKLMLISLIKNIESREQHSHLNVPKIII